MHWYVTDTLNNAKHYVQYEKISCYNKLLNEPHVNIYPFDKCTVIVQIRRMRQENNDKFVKSHYNDNIMSVMASQITSLMIVYQTVHSGAEWRKTSKLCVTGLCEGKSPVTDEFPAQRFSNAEKVSIWWCHQGPNYVCDGRWQHRAIRSKYPILHCHVDETVT